MSFEAPCTSNVAPDLLQLKEIFGFKVDCSKLSNEWLNPYVKWQSPQVLKLHIYSLSRWEAASCSLVSYMYKAITILWLYGSNKRFSPPLPPLFKKNKSFYYLLSLFKGDFPPVTVTQWWLYTPCCTVHPWNDLLPSSLYLPLLHPCVAPPPLPTGNHWLYSGVTSITVSVRLFCYI